MTASTSRVGRHGLDPSTSAQWYTIPSNTENARMITPLGSPVVRDPANTPAEPAGPTDDELLAAHAAVLADAIERALPGWVLRCVRDTAEAWAPGTGRDLEPAAEAAG